MSAVTRFSPGDRVEHVESKWHGTVQSDDGAHVIVKWDDGTDGILRYDRSVVFNAYRLVKLKEPKP